MCIGSPTACANAPAAFKAGHRCRGHHSRISAARHGRYRRALAARAVRTDASPRLAHARPFSYSHAAHRVSPMCATRRRSQFFETVLPGQLSTAQTAVLWRSLDRFGTGQVSFAELSAACFPGEWPVWKDVHRPVAPGCCARRASSMDTPLSAHAPASAHASRRMGCRHTVRLLCACATQVASSAGTTGTAAGVILDSAACPASPTSVSASISGWTRCCNERQRARRGSLRCRRG